MPKTLIALLTVLAVTSTLSAQAPDSATGQRQSDTGFLPSIAFRPLIADPFEAQLGGSIRAGDFTKRGALEAVASIGASFGLYGFTARAGKTLVQIGGSGGLVGRFDLHARGNVVSEDYQIGMPAFIKSGSFESRIRIFHRSAHIGDEYALANPDFTRFDLSYEAIEAVIAENLGAFRVYGGGDYQVHNATTPIEPGTLRAGTDVMSRREMGSGTLRTRWIAGLDLQAARDLSWRVAKSAVGGIEVRRASPRSPSLRILLELFSGPTTAGQFYGNSERYIGLAGYITQ
jgi:hypothetical protein